MGPVGRPYPNRWLVAALLLWGVGWLAPSESRAGCGHYATTRAHAAQAGLLGLDRLAVPGSGPEASWPGPPAPPCPGLGCPSGSHPPMTVPRALPQGDLWGCFDLGAFALRDPSSPVPFEDDRPRPSDRAERLARPPR